MNRKIESEVGGLRRELSDKIENLDSKSEMLENKLGELGTVKFLQRLTQFLNR